MPVNFPFTFSFNVPGLTNPFVPPPQTPTRRSSSRDDERIRSRATNAATPLPTQDKFQRRRPIPSPSRAPLPPLSRKRAWDPAFASPSESAATLASTSGYINTPAKYRAMAAQQTRATISRDDFHQVEYVDEDAVAGAFLISAEDKPFRREVFHAHAGYTCLSYTNSRVGEHVYKNIQYSPTSTSFHSPNLCHTTPHQVLSSALFTAHILYPACAIITG